MYIKSKGATFSPLALLTVRAVALVPVTKVARFAIAFESVSEIATNGVRSARIGIALVPHRPLTLISVSDVAWLALARVTSGQVAARGVRSAGVSLALVDIEAGERDPALVDVRFLVPRRRNREGLVIFRCAVVDYARS